MAFTFKFSGDDIISSSSDEEELSKDLAETTLSQPSHLPAKRHELPDLLSTLPSQLTYTVHTITNGTSTVRLPKRAHFDIQTQLKAESDPDTNSHDGLLAALSTGDLSPNAYEGGFKTWECALDLAAHLLRDDASSPLSSTTTPATTASSPDRATGSDPETTSTDPPDATRHVIELGCGSALPSLTLLSALLGHRHALPDPGTRWPSVQFTLADYNDDVIRLSTAPNVLLTALLSSRNRNRNAETDPADLSGANGAIKEPESDDAGKEEEAQRDEEEAYHDIDIDPATITSALTYLEERAVSFTFLSGSWNDPRFLPLVPPPRGGGTGSRDGTRSTTILAAETLYSPASLPGFVDTLCALLSRGGTGRAGGGEWERIGEGGGQGGGGGSEDSTAYIASKKIYFGVGGGVDEFKRLIKRHGRGDEWQGDDDARGRWRVEEVEEEEDVRDGEGVAGGGVGRVILTIRAAG